MWESWRHHNTQKRIIILGLKLKILYRTQTLLTPKRRGKKKRRERERERSKEEKKKVGIHKMTKFGYKIGCSLRQQLPLKKLILLHILKI